MNLIKPQKLNKCDKIATVSASLGIAGDNDVLWRDICLVKSGLRKIMDSSLSLHRIL